MKQGFHEILASLIGGQETKTKSKCLMKTMNFNSKMFVLINTTNYNSDSNCSVNVATLNELPHLGLDQDDIEKANLLNVDGQFKLDIGCYLMRIA